MEPAAIAGFLHFHTFCLPEPEAQILEPKAQIPEPEAQIPEPES